MILIHPPPSIEGLEILLPVALLDVLQVLLLDLGAQHTRKYTVLPGDFSQFGQTPELTPTLKMRRPEIQKKYLKYIEECYGQEDFKPFD
jgi:hypothetical protein